MAHPFTVSRSNWNLEMLVFVEGTKPDYPEKNPRSRGSFLESPGNLPGPITVFGDNCFLREILLALNTKF